MKNDAITKITAWEILDSRGNPTVCAKIELAGNNGEKIHGCASVPSGASTGKHEAFELRDGGKRFGGLGTLKAVSSVNTIFSKITKGKSALNQKQLDDLLIKTDGTHNKANLGANAILAASMCFAVAGAKTKKIPLYAYLKELFIKQKGKPQQKYVLPVPQFNLLNGGKHAGMHNDVQEVMLFPSGAQNFAHSLQIGSEVYHSLKKILKHKHGAQGTLVGDEGGFAPKAGLEEKLELLTTAIENAGYAKETKIAIDAAASEFFYEKHQVFTKQKIQFYQLGNRKRNAGELVDYYSQLSEKYKIISIEDGLSEDDWVGWKILNTKLGGKIQITGDDLLTTNPQRINKAIEEKACNSLLLKINQIGTITESMEAATLAFQNNWNVTVSHRSGETEDTFIADLAVALSDKKIQIKTGAPARSERVAKYNRLLEIEKELIDFEAKPLFAGKFF